MSIRCKEVKETGEVSLCLEKNKDNENALVFKGIHARLWAHDDGTPAVWERLSMDSSRAEIRKYWKYPRYYTVKTFELERLPVRAPILFTALKSKQVHAFEVAYTFELAEILEAVFRSHLFPKGLEMI